MQFKFRIFPLKLKNNYQKKKDKFKIFGQLKNSFKAII